MSTRFIPVALLTTACAREPEFYYIDVGVDVRLNAVAEVGSSFVAVGSGGTVVDSDGELWNLGGIELHDVAFGHGSETVTWLVVGGQGTVAKGVAEDNTPLKWTILELGVDSDLYAVKFRDTPTQAVIAGDETLRIWPAWEIEEWEEPLQWIEPPPPPGGWGRLRTLLEGPDGRLWAAGEQGRLLWSRDDLMTWTVDDANTTVNLNAGSSWNGRAWLLGDDGFLAYARPYSARVRESVGTKADLLSF